MSDSSVSTFEKTIDPIGQSPVSVPVLVLGKAALVVCCLFAIVKHLNLVSMLYDNMITEIAGAVLFAVGFVMLVIAVSTLGQSISVGLPRTKTELKTHGLYRFTRNPIYLGAFLMCAGSCLYAIHPVNFLLFAVTIVIHHVVVKKEEQFLERTFGAQWDDYMRRVPRYVGIVRGKQARLWGMWKKK